LAVEVKESETYGTEKRRRKPDEDHREPRLADPVIRIG